MKGKKLEEITLESSNVFRGKLLDVYCDGVRLSNGRRSVREWIRHLGASAVVPVLPDGSTLLVRQYRYPARREFLEVPAGKLDRDSDDPLMVAGRELAEETGYSGGTWAKMGTLYPCIGYSSEVIHFFLAIGPEQGTRPDSATELLETLRLPFDEAIAMVRKGQIQDMKTALALRMAHEHMELIDH